MSGFNGEQRLRRAIAENSNWGRWGADDQLGALNLVGPEQVAAAAAAVRRGHVVSLALPLDARGPQAGGRRGNPRLHMLAPGTDHLAGIQTTGTGARLPAQFGVGDDVLYTANQAGTHLDALSHIFWEGAMYNGHSAAEVTAAG